MTPEEWYLLCQRLHQLRLRSGLAVNALAPRIGRSPSHWHNVERGHKLPSLDALARFSRVVGVELVECFTWVRP